MLTVSEGAQLLHIHSNTVRRWADQGLIKAYRITSRGDRRFRLQDIAQFLTELNETNNDEKKVSLGKAVEETKVYGS